MRDMVRSWDQIVVDDSEQQRAQHRAEQQQRARTQPADAQQPQRHERREHDHQYDIAIYSSS
jgi:hypothetical protein